jgi:flagellar hook-length control protein FliK
VTADASVTVTPAGTAPSSNVAQPPSGAAKQDTGTGIVDIEKADATAGSASTAATPADDRSPVVGTAHALTPSSDPGAQTNATIQPPPPATTPPAAPVLAPLTVTAAINAPVPLSGLALELAASARSGKSRFEIRLDPADLGRIDVRIDVDRNGQVTSHLRVEKPETLSMLRQDAPQLQRALDDAGFKTGNGGLQFSLRDQSSSGQNSGNETGRNAQRLVVSEEDTIPAAIAGRTYGRVLGSSSGVDISV